MSARPEWLTEPMPSHGARGEQRIGVTKTDLVALLKLLMPMPQDNRVHTRDKRFPAFEETSTEFSIITDRLFRLGRTPFMFVINMKQ